MNELQSLLPEAHATLAAYLASVDAGARVKPIAGGLVNRTFAVGDGPEYALQLVAPQFGDEVNARIEKAGELLSEAGVLTPRLVRCDDGRLSLPAPDGRRWRLFRWIAGEVHATPPSMAHLHSAGCLLARFHDALLAAQGVDLVNSGFHDTAHHMARLDAARIDADNEVAAVADGILSAWRELRADLPSLPPRPGHGDPKLSNFIFRTGHADAIGLIDLDTMGLFRLDDDLGDLVRSCCNAASEDRRRSHFKSERFATLVAGYLGAAGTLSATERAAIPCGAARIALELAARFAADAVEQSYFAWDPQIAPDRRTHNLWRAEGQLDLARQIMAARPELERIVAGGG